MTKVTLLKQMLAAASPLLLFPVLAIPYQAVNHAYIVEWFGCGCPQIDPWGNIVHPAFNANDVTALFWLFVTACVIGISFWLSRKLWKEMRWLRSVYLVGMTALSLLMSYGLYRSMMWN